MQIQKPNIMFNAILWLFTAISINAKQKISVIHSIITKKLTVFNGQAYFFREKEVKKCLLHSMRFPLLVLQIVNIER